MADDALRSPGPLQFGRAPEGVTPRDRPAAFAVVEGHDRRIATVRITRETTYNDLPGGAIEAGETEAQACVREFGEETGLVIRPLRLIGRASQFLRTVDGEAVNNRCALFEATAVGADATLKIEADHTLEWLEPMEALEHLRHDAHAWAVAAWLRQRMTR